MPKRLLERPVHHSPHGASCSGQAFLDTWFLQFSYSNGVEIPKQGLSTWFISDDAVAQAVKEAVEIGYRHVNTAQAYENECGVGEGIRDCGVARQNIK